MKKVRLHQFLSRTGKFSGKSDLIESVRNREISVGGKVVTDIHFQFDPSKREVVWKGRKLNVIENKVYLMLNKPAGYLSSRLTPNDVVRRKKSVFELIRMDESIKRTLFCVGRLDEDTSGLLIITNDGELGHKITDPKKEIEKTYDVFLDKIVSEEDIEKLSKGVVIDLEENGVIQKYKTKSCRITRLQNDNTRLQNEKVRITITEGKKREVRRMFESIGRKVVDLKRIAIGKLELGEVGLGKYRLVDKSVVEKAI